MDQILKNLALMNTTEFCVANGIDCSGSHLLKSGRGFSYSLVRSESYEPIVTVTFHKTSSPTLRSPRDEGMTWTSNTTSSAGSADAPIATAGSWRA